MALADCFPMMFPDSGVWGVVIHTPYHGDALKEIGVQWVRVSVRWYRVEKGKRGSYDWSDADRLLNYYLDNGFRVMCVLTLENFCPLYESDRNNKPVVIDAISRWAGAAAERYKGRGILWELSNEPEVFPMGDYWNNPGTYTEMARKSAAAIKESDPEAKVAALSVAWLDRDFITRSLSDDLVRDGNIDVLTYHGYHRHDLTPESGLAEDMVWMHGMIRKYAPAGKHIIPVDSERGYAIEAFLSPKAWHSWRNIVYTEAEQAAYLARHYLETISLGVEIGVWYKDMSGESCFSLYYGDENDPRGLRPMGHVYRNLAALLPDNPKKLGNDRYSVSLVDQPNQLSAPDGTLRVRTYLRSYLQQGQDMQRLVIAMWNPVEAFDGRILDNRKRIGENYYEAWRAISPDDYVEIPTQVRITGLDPSHLNNIYLYDLLSEATEEAAKEIEPETENNSLISPMLKVGPMPTVLVIEIQP